MGTQGFEFSTTTMNSTIAPPTPTTAIPKNSTTATISTSSTATGSEITAITATSAATDSTSNPNTPINNNHTNTNSTAIITSDTINSTLILSPTTATTTPVQAPASIVNSNNDSSKITSNTTTAPNTAWGGGVPAIVDSYQNSTILVPQLMALPQTSSVGAEASTEIQRTTPGELATLIAPNQQDVIVIASSDASTNLAITPSQQILPSLPPVLSNSQQPMQIVETISLIENPATEVNNQNPSSIVQAVITTNGQQDEAISQENASLELKIATNNYLAAQLSQGNNPQFAQEIQDVEMTNAPVLQGQTAQVQPGIIPATTQEQAQPAVQAVTQTHVAAEMVQAVAPSGIVQEIIQAQVHQAQQAAELVAQLDEEVKARKAAKAQVQANIAQGNNDVNLEQVNEAVKIAEARKLRCQQIASDYQTAALNAVSTVTTAPETILATAAAVTVNQPQLEELIDTNPIVKAAIITTNQNLMNAVASSSVPVMDNGTSVPPLTILDAHQPNLVQILTPIVPNTASQITIVNVDEGTRRNSISSNSTQSSSGLSLSPMTASTTPNLPPINNTNIGMPTIFNVGGPTTMVMNNNNILGVSNHIKIFTEPAPPLQLDVQSTQQQLEQQAQQELQLKIQQQEVQEQQKIKHVETMAEVSSTIQTINNIIPYEIIEQQPTIESPSKANVISEDNSSGGPRIKLEHEHAADSLVESSKSAVSRLLINNSDESERRNMLLKLAEVDYRDWSDDSLREELEKREKHPIAAASMGGRNRDERSAKGRSTQMTTTTSDSEDDQESIPSRADSMEDIKIEPTRCGKAYYHSRSLRKHEKTHDIRPHPHPLPAVHHAVHPIPNNGMHINFASPQGSMQYDNSSANDPRDMRSPVSHTSPALHRHTQLPSVHHIQSPPAGNSPFNIGPPPLLSQNHTQPQPPRYHPYNQNNMPHRPELVHNCNSYDDRSPPPHHTQQSTSSTTGSFFTSTPPQHNRHHGNN
ncbi:6889_t:CDS:2 [Ambispora leptoticha]|uniref:6889_t:CDS:1 n=1 Tax=Ambispora leptoticha TaxID=144679 RepID=A0A9N8ZGZ3_9GLOM|nr:6889_t:CDS:2 [Ambispora leptoticha]